MGRLETQYLNTTPLKPSTWLRYIDLKQAFTSNLHAICTVCNISISTAPIHTIPNALSHTLVLSGSPASAPLMTYFKIISVPSPQSLTDRVRISQHLIHIQLDRARNHPNSKQPLREIPSAPNLTEYHPILTASPGTERVFPSCPKIVNRSLRISTRFSPEMVQSCSLPTNLASAIDPAAEPILVLNPV